jgi:subtilase family serine protease
MNDPTRRWKYIFSILKQAAGAALAIFSFLIFASAIAPAQLVSNGQDSHQTLRNHVRRAVARGEAVPLGLLPRSQRMNLAIMLPLRNQSELTTLLGHLYDPNSPDYRHFLTVAEFTEQFGPASEDYQAVVDFAKARGFAVTEPAMNRLLVHINGTVAQIETTFHLKMKVYQHPTEGRTFYSPDREPTLDLNVPVSHIAGLNNFSTPRPLVTKGRADQAIHNNVTGSGPGGAYLGSDMRAAYYGGTGLTGTGQSVGLLEFDGYNLGDVNLTFSNAGQSYAVPINNVLLDGSTGSPNGDDAEEVLDIVQAISMAPGLSQVRVYIGSSDVDILNAMATENIAKQLSCSWTWSPEDPVSDDPIFQEFAAQGQNLFVASGDWGGYPNFLFSYYYPAEDSYVTAVGGTNLTTNGAGGPWESETSWNDTPTDFVGSGGGISPDGIAIPNWQVAVANSSNGASTTSRNVPDVAMEADTDNYVCDMGACAGDWGGTSFAAPRWAGFLALVNEQVVATGQPPMGFVNPALYTIGLNSNYDTDFHDITTGNNALYGGASEWYGAYNVVPGYDLVTGWGSPSGQNLINALPAPGFALAASPNSLTIVQGGAGASSIITVSAVNGFTGSLSLAVSGLPSGVTGLFNPPTLSGGGTSTLTLTAGSTVTGGNAILTITGTSGNVSATTTIALSVNFAFAVTPTSQSVTAGSSTNSTATITMPAGFTGTVALSVAGLPTGATGIFTPPSLSASGASALAILATSATPPGIYALNVIAASGSLTQIINVNLVVNTVATGFTIGASPASVTLAPTALNSSGTSTFTVTSENGFSAPVLLTASGLPAGVTGVFSPNPVTPASNGTVVSVLTLAEVAWPAPFGAFPITVSASSGYQVANAAVALTVEPYEFLLITETGTIAQNSSSTGDVFAFWLAGSSPITLGITGLPSGVTALFSPNPVLPVDNIATATMTLTASPTATTGTFPITVTGSTGTFSNSSSVNLTVSSAGFTISASPATLTLGQNSPTSSTSRITVTSRNGFSSPVELGIVGLPDGVTSGVYYLTPLPNGRAFTNVTLYSKGFATTGTFPVTLYTINNQLATYTPLTLTVNSSNEPTYVTLTSAFNLIGIVFDGMHGFGTGLGLDTNGHAYSLGQINSSENAYTYLTLNGTPFFINFWGNALIPTQIGTDNVVDAANLNAISAEGQTIPLPSGNFSSLQMLGTGVNGNQTAQPFTVTYTDGSTTTVTQSLSDWQNPQNYPGELEALNMAYVDDLYTGGRVPAATYLYGYSFPLDETKTVASVTLPSNANVEVFAMTLVPAPAPTTTKLTSSENPSTYGQAVMFEATVTSSFGAPPDGETITFKNNQQVLGTGMLKAGSASLTTGALPGGTDSITAEYVGDATLEPSTSNAVNQIVKQIKTTTTLSSALNPSVYGQPVILTALVASVGGAPPDGEIITFMQGRISLGTGTLLGGTASFTTSTIKAGAAVVTAVYGGDSSLLGSTSGALRQVVGEATTTTALASSHNPSQPGQSLTFTATVTPEFSGTPTGKVAFYDGTTLLKTVALSGGTANLTTSKLTAGSHNINANYNGSASFISSSASLTQTVN